MNKREQLWSDYKKRVKELNDKHKAAVERAGNAYQRALKALDKADKPATVGKPKRSKARGTGTRS